MPACQSGLQRLQNHDLHLLLWLLQSKHLKKEDLSGKQLISKTVEEIDKGNRVTEQTATGFERIIKELEIFAESAKANSEVSKTQSLALQQVEEGVDQITLVTQQNAASSEECSAISEELAARATELDSLVNRFTLYSK